MSIISYAQNFEDVMLWRALKHVEIGFYIDVGANDPTVDSVTKAFYDHGWRGINIEPVAQWYEKLVQERPRDINLQLAVGAQAGEILLYELPDTGLSTANLSFAERYEAEQGYKKISRLVPVKSLTEICRDLHLSPIHFLKIDVEGSEKQVLEGLDFSIIRPWIVLVESTLPNSRIEEYAGWEPILHDANYEFIYFDGLNRFYIAQEHIELKEYFRIPPNLFDGFSLSGDATSSFSSHLLTQIKQANIKLLTATTQTEYLVQKLDDANNQLKERENKLAEQQNYIENLQTELGLARALVQTTQQKFEEREEKILELQTQFEHSYSELSATTDKIDELNYWSHYWWTLAEDLRKELQGLYKSKSWRITLPLRLGMKGITQPKRAAKYILRKMIRFVLAKPALRTLALRFISRRPELKARLQRIEQGKEAIKYSPSDEAMRYANLTARSNRIYRDLSAAIAKQQRKKEGN